LKDKEFHDKNYHNIDHSLERYKNIPCTNNVHIFLGEKVGVGHICLWCNEKGKAFQSVQAVQKHMLDKGHSKLVHEGDAVFEYADFYDYR
jgi:hypothetical protein